MAEILKSLKLVCVWLLLASYFLVIAEGRPYPVVEDGEKGALEGLNVRGMKTGGPSSKGVGHSSTDSRNLRATKMSGPSPGVGH